MKRVLFIAATLLLAAYPVESSSPLADAAEKQDTAAIEKLLREKANLNETQADGMTALHWAAYHDNLETAQRLVKSGANPRAENRYGVTPLSLACQNGNGPLVELLLEAGADPNTRLNGGETALMTAARTGKVGPVQSLLRHGAEVNAKEHRGQTAIMWAAAEGHTKVVERLIDAGADFQTPLESGFNPLFFAVREGRGDTVHALLHAGADVNAAMQPTKTSGRSVRRGTSPLMLALENGHFELASELLKAGADPNDSRSGFTPLHSMVWVRKPNRGDGENDLPPPIGSGSLGSLDFVTELIAHGANVNARIQSGRRGPAQLNRKGATAFFLAADTADVPLMKLLLELGADPLLRNADNATALMAAAGLGTLAPGEEAGTEPEQLEAIKLMLELGDDINAVDDSGETAMHGAAYKNAPAVVELLAEKGANIEIWNRQNKHGWTPLLIAQGYRPGNFRPSADTIAALHKVMLAAGVTPPIDPGTVRIAGPDYSAQ